MKILFLDIDGVLNNRETLTTSRTLEASDRLQWYGNMLSKDLISRLNKVLDQTHCLVVVSSTWRIALNNPEIHCLLMQKGFTGTILSATPRKTSNDHCRGDEIQWWLDENPFGEVKSFVIVDDNSDMGHLKDRLVQTSFETGLLDEHVDQMVQLLNENDKD